jgi:hypothetical protein
VYVRHDRPGNKNKKRKSQLKKKTHLTVQKENAGGEWRKRKKTIWLDLFFALWLLFDDTLFANKRKNRAAALDGTASPTRQFFFLGCLR